MEPFGALFLHFVDAWSAGEANKIVVFEAFYRLDLNRRFLVCGAYFK